MQSRYFVIAVLVATVLCLVVDARKANVRAPPPPYDGIYSLIRDGNSQMFQIEYKDDPYGLAWASYRNTMNTTGWAILNISTNPQVENELQAYAAGYLEGALLQTDIYNAWLSFAQPFYNTTDFPSNIDFTSGIPFPEGVTNFIEDNTNWVRTTFEATNTTDYAIQVTLVLKQLDGIVDGYNDYAAEDQRLSYWNFVAWQLQDELNDIYPAVQSDVEHPAAKTRKQMLYSDHCSVLIKPTADNGSLFASHVTWSGYASMLRTYKHTNFSFNGIANVPQVSYSSEPGFIPSGDDFFITGANLVVLETTNDIFNLALYTATTTETVPYWMRVMVANRMATTGQQWVEIFSQWNSGTYNNQWIVVDYKQFTSGKPLQPGTLWIAEQIPGYVVSQDMTDHLATYGYWPSYNVPYFEFVYNVSGYPAMYEKYGNSMSYSMCPRAQIFRRDQGNITNFEEYVNVMRSNNWATDPLSLGDPCNQVSARCDLDVNTPGQAFGGIDCKATDNTQSYLLQAQAISGPTTENEPPFSWTEEFATTPHYGQPYTFNFEFQTMSPST